MLLLVFRMVSPNQPHFRLLPASNRVVMYHVPISRIFLGVRREVSRTGAHWLSLFGVIILFQVDFTAPKSCFDKESIVNVSVKIHMLDCG